MKAAREAAADGANVLLMVITAKHATRMRRMAQDTLGITVNTCHAAFRLDGPKVESMPTMQADDIVVVDEFSLPDREQFEPLEGLASG